MTNDLGIANSSARVLPAKTVCLSRTASVGYVVVTALPMATSQDFVNWICGDELEPEFLKYLFLAEGDNLVRFSSGAVHQTIYFPEAKAFHVCVPARAEQQRIVAVLDEAFEGIAAASANVATCVLSARELGAIANESIFVGGGEHWTERPLANVADIVNGYAFKSTSFQAAPGVRSIKIANVGVKEFVAESGDNLPADFSELYSAAKARTGDIVIALTRTIVSSGLKVAQVPAEYDGALVNQRVAAIRPRAADLPTPFLLGYLSTQRVANYVKGRVNTLMQPNLSIADLRSLPVPVPPTSDHSRLVDTINQYQHAASALARCYARKLAALDELKKSLLHQAFTGAL